MFFQLKFISVKITELKDHGIYVANLEVLFVHRFKCLAMF